MSLRRTRGGGSRGCPLRLRRRRRSNSILTLTLLLRFISQPAERASTPRIARAAAAAAAASRRHRFRRAVLARLLTEATSVGDFRLDGRER